VVNTHLLYQLGPPDRRRLVTRLQALTRKRELHWLSGEAMTDRPQAPTLRHTTTIEGERRVRRLLRYEKHGRWVEWLDEPIDA
jgi:hypothetical protein